MDELESGIYNTSSHGIEPAIEGVVVIVEDDDFLFFFSENHFRTFVTESTKGLGGDNSILAYSFSIFSFGAIVTPEPPSFRCQI